MLNYKEIQTIIAIITEDKVTELFCMTDDFCKFFDALMKKYTMKSDTKRHYWKSHSTLTRHYKIFCVNGNTGFRNESRIFYFIHLQNEEAYERKESSSA